VAWLVESTWQVLQLFCHASWFWREWQLACRPPSLLPQVFPAQTYSSVNRDHSADIIYITQEEQRYRVPSYKDIGEKLCDSIAIFLTGQTFPPHDQYSYKGVYLHVWYSTVILHTGHLSLLRGRFWCLLSFTHGSPGLPRWSPFCRLCFGRGLTLCNLCPWRLRPMKIYATSWTVLSSHR